jgi:hypothetical protein
MIIGFSKIRLLIFAICMIILTGIYYRFMLSVGENESKGIKLMIHLFGINIIFGLIYVASKSTKGVGQFLMILLLLILINIYNINTSIKKCNYPKLYKFNLFGRSSLIIIILASIVYFSLNNDIFSFLYSSESDKPYLDQKGTNWTDIDLADVKLPHYCPDMNNLDESDEKWKSLTADKQSKCKQKQVEINERNDMSSGIYA